MVASGRLDWRRRNSCAIRCFGNKQAASGTGAACSILIPLPLGVACVREPRRSVGVTPDGAVLACRPKPSSSEPRYGPPSSGERRIPGATLRRRSEHRRVDFVSTWDPHNLPGAIGLGAAAWGIEDPGRQWMGWTEQRSSRPLPAFQRPCLRIRSYSADSFEGEHYVMKGSLAGDLPPRPPPPAAREWCVRRFPPTGSVRATVRPTQASAAGATLSRPPRA